MYVRGTAVRSSICFWPKPFLNDVPARFLNAFSTGNLFWGQIYMKLVYGGILEVLPPLGLQSRFGDKSLENIVKYRFLYTAALSYDKGVKPKIVGVFFFNNFAASAI